MPPWVMAAQEGGEFNAFPDLPPANAPADDASAGQAAQDAAAAGSALKPLGINGVLAPGARRRAGRRWRARRRAPSPTTPRRWPLRRRGRRRLPPRARVRRGQALPRPGLGLPAARRGARQRRPVARRAPRTRPRPVPRGDPGGRPGRRRQPRPLRDRRLRHARRRSRRTITTDLLRKRARFEGIAITDDLADPPITALGSTPDAAVEAVRAGADMLYISGPAGEQQAAYVAVLRAVRKGEITAGRLDEAVLRILAVKQDYGLIGVARRPPTARAAPAAPGRA